MKPSRLFGVVKTFDLGGKVCDAMPYFGRGDVRFGKTEKSYRLARVALVTPYEEIPISVSWWSWDAVAAGAVFAVERLRIT